jgi:hypothetical protein
MDPSHIPRSEHADEKAMRIRKSEAVFRMESVVVQMGGNLGRGIAPRRILVSLMPHRTMDRSLSTA